MFQALNLLALLVSFTSYFRCCDFSTSILQQCIISDEVVCCHHLILSRTARSKCCLTCMEYVPSCHTVDVISPKKLISSYFLVQKYAIASPHKATNRISDVDGRSPSQLEEQFQCKCIYLTCNDSFKWVHCHIWSDYGIQS